jgi:MSHA pilin protein MshC
MKQESGFTIVELVAIIVLMGVLAFSFMPRYPGLTIELNGQAEQLASDIRFAQSLSMTHGARYCIFFNTAQSQYQFRNTNCTTAVVHPATGSTAYITFSNVTMALNNISGTYIEFDTKGKPYTFTASATNATVTLTSSGDTRSVSVSPETGRVLVQ